MMGKRLLLAAHYGYLLFLSLYLLLLFVWQIIFFFSVLNQQHIRNVIQIYSNIVVPVAAVLRHKCFQTGVIFRNMLSSAI